MTDPLAEVRAALAAIDRSCDEEPDAVYNAVHQHILDHAIGWLRSLVTALEDARTRLATAIHNASHVRCEVHKVDASNAWGCPGCVAELRTRLATAEGERDRFRSIGQGFERDMHKHFEQGCLNLKRAEGAEAEVAALRADLSKHRLVIVDLGTENERLRADLAAARAEVDAAVQFGTRFAFQLKDSDRCHEADKAVVAYHASHGQDARPEEKA